MPPPLYFAVQNTEEEIESNPPLIAVRYSAYGARQGRSLEVALYSFAIFLIQPPRPAGTPPIFSYATPRNAAGHGRGRGGLTLPLLVFLIPLLVATLLSSPLYFLAPHTAMLRGTAGEEGESNPPLIAVRYFVYGVRQGRIVIQRTFFPCLRKSLLH